MWDKFKFYTRVILFSALALYLLVVVTLNWGVVVDGQLRLVFTEFDKPRVLMVMLDTIDFPTANIALGDYLRPAYGVYAVRGRLEDGRALNGAANLGIRPQFDPPKELLEPYFFDFSGDLYEQELTVELVRFLRPEAKFDSLDALTAQIEADCAAARSILTA